VPRADSDQVGARASRPPVAETAARGWPRCGKVLLVGGAAGIADGHGLKCTIKVPLLKESMYHLIGMIVAML
jgi:hypothetical protein